MAEFRVHKGANLICRVNFEFANPVEIRKGSEFEDRELPFSKNDHKGFSQRARIPCVLSHRVGS